MDPEQQKTLRQAFLKADKSIRPMLRKLMPVVEAEWGGVRLELNPRDNFTEMKLWLDGAPVERQSLELCRDLVKGKQAYILDIGANCGMYSCVLAKAAGDGSRVVAFEPNPAMIGRLGGNIQRNDLGQVVRVEGVALGAAEGEAELRLKRGNLGQASINPDSPAQGMRLVVPMRPLRPYLQGLKDYEFSLMKIDIEGAEAFALGPWLDASVLDERPDAILMETAHPHLWNRDLVSEIKAFGYGIEVECEGNTLFRRKDP